MLVLEGVHIGTREPATGKPLKIELQIPFNVPYKVFETLETEELPDFAILIGRNGSGKSQLLDALMRGAAKIPDIRTSEIELYDMGSFHPPNANYATRSAYQFARTAADAYLLPQGGRPPIEMAKIIFKRFANDIERDSGAKAREDFESNLREEIRQLPDFAEFAANHRDFKYRHRLYQEVFAPLNSSRGGSLSNRTFNSFNGNPAALLSTAMKRTSKLPHELTRDDIMDAALFEGDTISNSISEIFLAYKVRQYMWVQEQFQSGRNGFASLNIEYRNTYQPPWVTLRDILSAMRDEAGDDGFFDFEFSDPDDYELNIGNYEQFSFKTEMTNLTTGARYEIDSLSSGEKILMALCLVSFDQYLGRRVPKLLLLDELDAMLHPSMVAPLVKALKNMFVSKGTKVLMTSHSAMTVAVLDETDIFRVERKGRHVKVSQTTKSEAINELTDGLATVDVGIKIAASAEAEVTILTEGHNAKHLKRWVKLNFPTDVHVFEELGQYTNDEQLLTYGRLLGRMNTNTHFVIVWDCDAAGKAKTLREDLPNAAKVTPYAFALRQENTIVRRGIENIYDEGILEPYSTTTKRDDGTLLARGLDNNLKTEFANHVLQHGTAEYFTHLQDLHAIITGILGSAPIIASPESEAKTVTTLNGEDPELPTNAPFPVEIGAVLE